MGLLRGLELPADCRLGLGLTRSTNRVCGAADFGGADARVGDYGVGFASALSETPIRDRMAHPALSRREPNYGRFSYYGNTYIGPIANLAHRRAVTGDGRLTGRVRFPRAGFVSPYAGGSGHRPVRRVPDCEVLAALVPERVLPFASGGSRKRGPEPSRGSKLGAVPRRSAERRARSLPSPAQAGADQRPARAASQDAASVGCALRRSASLLLREVTLEWFAWE